MSDELRDSLLASLDKEARRFDRDHPGEETTLYARAIGSRRRARTLAAVAGGLAAAGAVAVGAYALGPLGDPATPAPVAATPVPTAEASPAAAWAPPADLDPDRSAATLQATWGATISAAPECLELDAAARLEGSDALGGEAESAGALVTEGGTNGLHAREFSSEESRAAFLASTQETAAACGAQVAEDGLTVKIAEVGLARIPGGGEGIRVDVSDAEGTDWSAWVYGVGAEALAVVVEPGASSLAGEAIIEWFAAGA